MNKSVITKVFYRKDETESGGFSEVAHNCCDKISLFERQCGLK